MDVQQAAEANFRRHLSENVYPGRGLVVGRAPSGDWLQVYWIMGRSESSRNRRFEVEGATVRTAAVDPSRVRDPSLIIYRAMAELPGLYVVSNGDQTDTITAALAAGGTFAEALARREREPDAPNYTPRISALLSLRAGEEPGVQLSILRANDAGPERTDRTWFAPAPPPPGLGYGLTTYVSDGDPLPPFRGDPLWLPLRGPAEEVADGYWAALDGENKVALAVKAIGQEGGTGSIVVRNRYG